MLNFNFAPNKIAEAPFILVRIICMTWVLETKIFLHIYNIVEFAENLKWFDVLIPMKSSICIHQSAVWSSTSSQHRNFYVYVMDNKYTYMTNRKWEHNINEFVMLMLSWESISAQFMTKSCISSISDEYFGVKKNKLRSLISIVVKQYVSHSASFCRNIYLWRHNICH